MRRRITHGSKPQGVALLGEVCRALNLKRSACYLAALRGDLPVRFVGGRYEMRRRDLDRLVRQRAATANAPELAAAS